MTRAVASAATIRVRADSDFDELIRLQSFAGHRDQNAIVADANEASEGMGANAERAGTG
jgi:hypothetical protein